MPCTLKFLSGKKNRTNHQVFAPLFLLLLLNLFWYVIMWRVMYRYVWCISVQ